VLEPLAGYLLLAERLCGDGAESAEAWNFGPDQSDVQPVQWIVERLCAELPGARWTFDDRAQPHEAHALTLDSAKARARLGWRPRWRLETAVAETLAWHRAWKAAQDMHAFTLSQIAAYEASPAS
jgi:CDP-glucose 4,6-dehydratase